MEEDRAIVHGRLIASRDMISRTVPFSMTLNDPWPRFQGHAVIRRLISRKEYKIAS